MLKYNRGGWFGYLQPFILKILLLTKIRHWREIEPSNNIILSLSWRSKENSEKEQQNMSDI